MGIRSTLDRRGSSSNTLPVDKMVGTAYDIVKSVSEKLPIIVYLEQNVDGLVGDIQAAMATTLAAEQTAIAKAAEALASQMAAAASEAAAHASELAAAEHEAGATAQAAAALASQQAAALSEANAADSEVAAAASQRAAALSEANADASKVAAAQSAAGSDTARIAAELAEQHAQLSETNASDSEAAALVSQTAAADSEAKARTSELNAKDSETKSKVSETNTAASAADAASSLSLVQGILSTMNALYLGKKAADPTTDNNGDPLAVGAEYFNTVTNMMRVYQSDGWHDQDETAITQAANATAAASAASGSAAAALVSQTAAAASASAADGFKTAAADSAAAADGSKQAAALSATAADGSKQAAAVSEGLAHDHEVAAAGSATAAGQSATAAYASELAAAASAIAASGLQFSGVVSLSADQDIDPTFVGKAVKWSKATAGTLTLFTAIQFLNGRTLTFFNVGVGPLTLALPADGSQFAFAGALYQTITLNRAEWVTLVGRSATMVDVAAGNCMDRRVNRKLIGTIVDDGTSVLQVGGNTAVTGSVNVAGNVTVDKAAADALLTLSTVDGAQSSVMFSKAMLNRWRVGRNNATEAGANAGSDFSINRYDDSGTLIDTPLKIARSTGLTTLAGDLTFSGAARRIRGDMSNATVANRLLFQTTTPDSPTVVGAIPNGAGTQANYNAYSNADTNNATLGQLLVVPGETRLSTQAIGATTAPALTFYTGATLRYTISAVGSHTFEGGVQINGGNIELGAAATTTALLDFHSSGLGTDYDSRIISTGGAAASGQGNLTYAAASHTFQGNMIVDYSGAGVLSKLFYMRGSGGYAPHMRVNGSPQQWEWVNNANNAINMSLSDGGVLNLPRARPTWAGVTPWDTGNLPSPAQTNGSIYTALHLRLASGTDSTWNFSGQAGQPSWMWGSNDGANMLVWNPANFSVNYANSAGVAASANSVGGVTDPASRSAGAQFGGGVSVAANFGLNYSSQGGKFVWNDVGTGETCLVNNQGLGSGGFVFRTVNNANTAELGRFTITAAGAGSQGSDRNLKEDIQDLSDSLDKIRSIRGVSYAYKANGEKHYGVIAQEVREVFPYCVNENHGAGTKEKYLGVSYNDLVAPLIEAVKELADKLDNANARIAALEMRNAA